LVRHHRLLIALLPAVLAITVAGCGGTAPKSSSGGGSSNNLTNGFPLTGASLPSYTADYAITGAATGTASWTVTQSGQETLVTIQTNIAGSAETDKLVLTRKGLRFVSAEEVATAPGQRFTITAKLQGKKIVETANVNGKAESISYPYTKTTVVNDALLPLLAGLDVQPGELQVAQDVILKHGVAVPIGFTANDRTAVTTPAGTFHCVSITLSGSGPNQKVYIDTGAHVLVRYVNNQTTFTLQKLTR